MPGRRSSHRLSQLILTGGRAGPAQEGGGGWASPGESPLLPIAPPHQTGCLLGKGRAMHILRDAMLCKSHLAFPTMGTRLATSETGLLPSSDQLGMGPSSQFATRWHQINWLCGDTLGSLGPPPPPNQTPSPISLFLCPHLGRQQPELPMGRCSRLGHRVICIGYCVIWV